MALDACTATPRALHVLQHGQDSCRAPPLLPDVRLHDWNSCKAPQQLPHGWPHASVTCAAKPRAWSIHLVLLHVRLHVLLPCTVPPRASIDTQLAGYGCEDMIWGRGLFIEDNNQSASGWWQPVCRFAWLRMHVQRYPVLHMSGCMSRTHAERHHSSQISGCMTGTHARRHSITQMAGRMLRLHERRHLVLGRSTSCFYMSSCMQLPYTVTTRASVDTQLAEQLTPCSDPLDQATSSCSVCSSDFDSSGEFSSHDQSQIFF
ncbi:hypothetical protein F2Q68_00010563 [Brassica cretica]|uniref:Uncharacterized protein n=1 Tax=Brassica cretica TaxID=69181 RepID=A0A8S9KQN2_BRACR|nr:hypothetical protein F2Q68_00010563 [Brassica cretica]